METLVSLHNIVYHTADGQLLFGPLNLDFQRERTGLIGDNGVGKSTLLKIIAGELSPSAGTIQTSDSARLLQQIVTRPTDDQTIIDAFNVRTDWNRLQLALQGRFQDDDVDIDWQLESRVHRALASVDLPSFDVDRSLDSLSGGQLTRVRLAAVMFDDPPLVLLDEPTNNLDQAGRSLVWESLKRSRAGTIVVSHDRDLLDGMDRIVELQNAGVKSYGGNWTFQQACKQAEMALAEQRLGSARWQVHQARRSIQQARERKHKSNAQAHKHRQDGSTGKMALDAAKQSAEDSLKGVRRLETRKIEATSTALAAARAAVEQRVTIDARLPSTHLPTSKTVLTCEHVSFAYPNRRPVLQDLAFSVVGPERVAIVGSNGAGKSTLLKLMCGQLQATQGRVTIHVDQVMLDQQVDVLDQHACVLENFRRLNPQDDETSCRNALAHFQFKADYSKRLVHELSGGEILRCGLACILGGQSVPALLLLDEPANHLDLASLQAIEAGLQAYDGALLTVSHDERFLAGVGVTRRFELNLPDTTNTTAD